MVSLDHSSQDSKPSPIEEISSPRISFSSEFLDESNFITICPNPREEAAERAVLSVHSADFEFLSGNLEGVDMMMTADELFREGKMLPFLQPHNSTKLNAIHLKTSGSSMDGTIGQEDNVRISGGDSRVRWLLDDDPSPRPPNCIVLWKELLKLKKRRRPSTLSPSSSSSSSSSSKSSMQEVPIKGDKKDRVKGEDKTSNEKKTKKVVEKRNTSNIKIRPVINVPICTTLPPKNSALPPLFSMRKGRIER